MQHSFSTDLHYRGDLGKEATMLVLTRRIGETLLIGNDVTVTVLGVNRQQVRIGIEADRSIPVHREEIYAKIRHREQPSLQIGSHVGNEDHEARM